MPESTIDLGKRPPRATLAAFAPSIAEEIRRSMEEAAALPAVDIFSQWHETTATPAHEGLYRALLPATDPGPGEQYAFEVDLDRCSGCKACVASCHSQNGLDEDESWRTTGALVGTIDAARLTVTTSCHHCADPGCASGCPTLAYEKDELTGIVRHLDDQCMGCQYCTWTCPYDAPKWNPRLGIVRKCDMCRGRLQAGEAPACVQSCPHQAIRIVTISRDELAADLGKGTRLPGIVPPEHTGPSTRYVGEVPDGLVPEDAHDLVPEHGHTPLAILLVLSQWSVGTWLLLTVSHLAGHPAPVAANMTATGLLVAGLLIGTLHLGRPERAWKAFLGWRRSWFSREVLAFGNAVPLCAAASLPPGILPEWTRLPLLLGASGLLLAGAASSAMLYMVTPRPAWARPGTAIRFALTALGGGAVVLGAFGGDGIRLLGILSIATGVAKSLTVLRDRKAAPGAHPALVLQARLLSGPLSGPAFAQFHLFLAAVACAVAATILASPALFAATIVFRLSSDLVERSLFFRACPGTRMPGGAGRAA